MRNVALSRFYIITCSKVPIVLLLTGDLALAKERKGNTNSCKCKDCLRPDIRCTRANRGIEFKCSMSEYCVWLGKSVIGSFQARITSLPEHLKQLKSIKYQIIITSRISSQDSSARLESRRSHQLALAWLETGGSRLIHRPWVSPHFLVPFKRPNPEINPYIVTNLVVRVILQS